MPPPSKTPKTISAWTYTPPLTPSNLTLSRSLPLPVPKPNLHLLRIHHCTLNPLDYKPASIPFVSSLLIRHKPAVPGCDIAGQIVIPATGSGLKPGDYVFGVCGTNIMAGGGMAEYAVAKPENVMLIPRGLGARDASTIFIAGLSAYQSIVPHVRRLQEKAAKDAKEGGGSGSGGAKPIKVFINGGSGGVGSFGIQFAKALGCYVVTTCSGRNVEYCKSLGADEVIDYTTTDVAEALIASTSTSTTTSASPSTSSSGQKIDHVVDNISTTPSLWYKSHLYTHPHTTLVIVGGVLTWSGLWEVFKRQSLPRFMGGVKRKIVGFFPDTKLDDVSQIAEWMVKGKVRACVEKVYSLEEGGEAMGRMRSGRVRGKVVVDMPAAAGAGAGEGGS